MRWFSFFKAVRKPDFLLIGAQKCGTSWLHHHLRLSESIFMQKDKDRDYFSYVGHLTNRAFRRYCAQFSDAGAGQLVGEASASYFWTRTGSKWSRQPDNFNPEIPASIRRFCGSRLKLILMLRDPVERAISAYLHHIRHGAITPETSILDTQISLGIIDMGFYRHHLENWQAVFPEENFHIIRGLPGTGAAAVETLEAVLRFLNAKTIPIDNYYFEPVAPGFQRITDETGVWLLSSIDYPGKASASPVPCAEFGGETYSRVVSPSELDELREILAGNDIGCVV
jgi:Sulfotransferase domain